MTSISKTQRLCSAEIDGAAMLEINWEISHVPSEVPMILDVTSGRLDKDSLTFGYGYHTRTPIPVNANWGSTITAKGMVILCTVVEILKLD